MSKNPKYWGKYRGYVADVNDPLKKGRIRVECPAITGGLTEWCMPCISACYDEGGDFHYPKIGEVVFIEFEEGDRQYPIYTGGYFKDNSVPIPEYDPDKRLISWGNNKILMEKDTLTFSNGKCNVVLKENSVEINAAKKVTLKGESDVNIISNKAVNINSSTGLNISAPNSLMSFDNGNMDFTSSQGSISIKDSNINVSSNGIVNFSINGGKGDNDSIALDSSLIAKLKRL